MSCVITLNICIHALLTMSTHTYICKYNIKTTLLRMYQYGHFYHHIHTITKISGYSHYIIHNIRDSKEMKNTQGIHAITVKSNKKA